MTTPDPKTIAAKLTKAQRCFVLAAPTSPEDATAWWNERTNWTTHRWSWLALNKRGLADSFGALRPLGLAVRAEIEKEMEK